MNESPTVSELRSDLRRRWNRGTQCPVCEQHVQLYRRCLNAGQLRVLLLMAATPNTWVHVDRELIQGTTRWKLGRDFSILRFWGLIERHPRPEDRTKRYSGLWRITSRGLAFARGEITLRRKVLHFNDHAFGFEGEEVEIRDVIKDEFDYLELLKGGE